MRETFNTIHEFSFKDDSPQGTVDRIKAILKENDIETEEFWRESGVPYCYSLQIRVVGSVFTTAGKGVTRDLALASAYGELMERLQLGFIFAADQQKDPAIPAHSANAESVPVQTLLQRNDRWYTLYTDALRKQTGIELTNEDLLMQYADANGNVSATSYYCLNTKTNEYIPDMLREAVYTSNGCAAGNTMEEAIVQAISEIMERYHKLRVLSEEIPVPDIPENVLESCGIAYEIIKYLRNNGFRVIIKDCSLGTKFPVVCVCLIEQSTGRYHTHFGAYPNFEIALSRTLTETFQSNNIKGVARYDNFSSDKDSVYDLQHLMNELVRGTAQKKPEFFLARPDEPYTKPSGFSGKNNTQLLLECISFIQEQGYDVLIRDCSCLNFPTYQVIIPGLSESYIHRLSSKRNDIRFKGHALAVLRNPSVAKIEDIMGFMMYLSWMSQKKLRNASFSKLTNIPAQMSSAEDSYLMNACMAHINYTLGRYKEVIKYIDNLISSPLKSKSPEDEGLLIIIKRYLTLKSTDRSSDQIRSILDYFHKPETVNWLYSCIENNKNPMDAFTLHCDLKCEPSCKLFSSCKKNVMDKLTQLIADRQKKMNNAILRKQFQRIMTLEHQ